MSAYLVFNYAIKNRDGYQQYPPAAMPTLGAHNAEVLVADYQSDPKEGSPGHVTVVLRFESKEAATAWYESPEYQAIMHHRTDNADGVAVLCDGFEMPGWCRGRRGTRPRQRRRGAVRCSIRRRGCPAAP